MLKLLYHELSSAPGNRPWFHLPMRHGSLPIEGEEMEQPDSSAQMPRSYTTLYADTVVRPSQHTIPPPRGIERKVLQRHLEQSLRRPITLVMAAAGMGKTQALARCVRSQRWAIPIWYTLQSDDAVPQTMLARLCWALATAVPALREPLAQYNAALYSGRGDWSTLLDRWLDVLHQSPQPILLCLDGVTEVQSPLAASIDQLMGRLHPRLHLVVTCRTRPEDAWWSACARLWQRGQLTLLTNDLFRFSLDEVEELCRLYGYTASQHDVASLQRLTDGWAYLLDAALRSHQGQALDVVLASLSTIERSSELDAWFHAQLAAACGADELEQVICSAVPGRLTPTTVASVCGVKQEYATLERWASIIPMLHAVGPQTYAYHPLFRDFLRRQFLRLPQARRLEVVRASATAAAAGGDWPEALAILQAHGDWPELCRLLQPRAAELARDVRLDSLLTAAIARLPHIELCFDTPWLLCYQALERRLVRGDYVAARRLAQLAMEQFERLGDGDGYAYALASVAIARYHLGQYAAALAELDARPCVEDPTCRAALSFAAYLNYLGLDQLEQAIRAAHCGLHALEYEPREARRIHWRIVLQRNLVAAYHFRGELAAARRAGEEAVALAERHFATEGFYAWSLYELGLLEQRAGRLDLALTLLQQARTHLEQTTRYDVLWRWILVAQGHTLRDMGDLEAADERYRLGGWGEGEDGPLMLWLLQGRYAEARYAAESRLTTGMIESPIERTNLGVLLALLDLEHGATPEICRRLRAAAEQYQMYGFRYTRASLLLHLAAAEYELGNTAAADQPLAEALRFAAAQGYLNFDWWHPERMQRLLHHACAAGIEPVYSARLLQERGLAAPSASEKAGVTKVMVAPDIMPPAMTRLVINCLGQFRVCIDDEPLPRARWQGYPAGALRMQRLLVYLAQHRQPQPMSAIARYVWPDRWDCIDVATNFHLTLAGLRRVLEPDLAQGRVSRFVLTASDGYLLHPDLQVVLDLNAFQTSIRSGWSAHAEGRREAARSAFLRAEQLYQGDFALAKSDPGEGEEYRRAFLQAIYWLAEDDLCCSQAEACRARAQRILREDPWHTGAAALLLKAYLASGNRRAARRHYERLMKIHDSLPPEIVQIARTYGL